MAFVKFMRNKFFHPHTFENQKRTWIAEQKHESEKKKQEELHKQYLKEQAIYENKNLLKHGKLTQDDKLSFMYEPPLECRKKDDKLELREVRFEWQKNAPRAGEYAKNIEVTDRPFGIEVRNTKCIKCGVWGHMNTDKICPLYNQGLNTEDNPPELGKEDPMSLLNSMERGGLKMRKHAVNSVMDVHDNKYGMLEDEKLDPEVAFIANLTDKQKRKLMRKLNKNESGVGYAKKGKHKARKKEKKSKHNEFEDGTVTKTPESHRDQPQNSTSNSRRSNHKTDYIQGNRRHRSRSPNIGKADNRKERNDRVSKRKFDDQPSKSHKIRSTGSATIRHDSLDSDSYNENDKSHKPRKRLSSNRKDGKRDSDHDFQKNSRNKRHRQDHSKSPKKSTKRHDCSSETDSSKEHSEENKNRRRKTKCHFDSERKSTNRYRHKNTSESKISPSSE